MLRYPFWIHHLSFNLILSNRNKGIWHTEYVWSFIRKSMVQSSLSYLYPFSSYCTKFLQQLWSDSTFALKVFSSDKSTSFLNGEINRQNIRYCCDINPHCIQPGRIQGTPKLTVWYEIWKTRIITPAFVDSILTDDSYLRMVQESALPLVLNE